MTARALTIAAALLTGCATDVIEVERVVPVEADSGGDAALETGPADTGGDSEDVATADAAADAEPDATDVERSRCLAGAPRLTWSDDGGCVDTAPPSGGAVPCAFVLADDGPRRCLPRPHGKVVAAFAVDCALDGPRLLDVIVPPKEAAAIALATVQRDDGRHEVRAAERVAVVEKWRWVFDGVCNAGDAIEAFPYRNGAWDSIRVTDKVPAANFVAAP